MKILKLLVSTALVATTTPAFVSPAYATSASADTETRMTNTCAALVDSSVMLHDGTQVYSTAVVNVVPTEESPIVTDTEITGTRVGSGTPSYSGLSIGNGPFRIGGSVNMFGDQVATTKTYPSYTFKFDRSTSTKTNYTFDCEITQATETYVPPVHIPGHKVEGYYVNCDFGNGQGHDNGNTCTDSSQPQGSCLAHNNTGDTLPFWGEDTEQCRFVKTKDAVDPVDTEEEWIPGDDIVTLRTGFTDTQTDVVYETNLDGFANLPLTLTGNWYVGQVVICISPTLSTQVKKGVPGTWKQQNGYTGDKCTTAWFNVAPWGGGSQDSNGTYISVPGV